MEYKDYYGLLGVSRDSTQDEIKRAYRKLSRKYHPDVNKDSTAEDRFKELSEANEVLKDPEKRAAYDRLGSNWKSGQEFRPPPEWDAGFEFSGGGFTAGDAGFHSDFFEALFGSAFGGGRGTAGDGFRGQGNDHHAKMVIDLEDSIHGATRSIVLQRPEVTNDGHVRLRDRTLKVRIPKGVRRGQTIRLTGQGTDGMYGGKPGDLYLEIDFRQHPLYRVDGGDIHLDLPVAPWEAALGAKVQVPTPHGTADLRVPANTRSGSSLRLKGRGLPGAKPGDLYVRPIIVLPKADTEDARALYHEMSDRLAFDPRSGMKGT